MKSELANVGSSFGLSIEESNVLDIEVLCLTVGGTLLSRAVTCVIKEIVRNRGNGNTVGYISVRSQFHKRSPRP